MKKAKLTFYILLLLVPACAVKKQFQPTLLIKRPADTIHKISTQIITYKPKIYDYKRLDSIYQPLFKSNYYSLYAKQFDTLKRQQNKTDYLMSVKMDSLAMNQKSSTKLESLLLQLILQSKEENHIQKDTIKKLKTISKVSNEVKIKAEAHDTLDKFWVYIGLGFLAIRLILTIWAWFNLHIIRINIEKKHNYV